jgi:putative ABC transport system substrate-binding protein
MNRRTAILLLGGAAAASVSWPLAARAQKGGKLPTIGFLGVTTPSGWSHYVAAFERRLRELGWIEGRTVAIEFRWAEGRSERFGEIAAELVRSNVDIIVTGGGAVVAAKQATSTIPIAFALANDPVGIGLVASLSLAGLRRVGKAAQQKGVHARLRGLGPRAHAPRADQRSVLALGRLSSGIGRHVGTERKRAPIARRRRA